MQLTVHSEQRHRRNRPPPPRACAAASRRQPTLPQRPLLSQVRRKELPPEYWEARRRALNHSRLQRNYARRRRRGDAMRQEEAQRMASMDEQQAAAYRQQREAERDAAKAAASAQRQQVAQAMQHGLRVVVDCSLSLAACHSARCDHDASSSGDAARASDREIRSLCKQLELCAAANKRATRPVSLQFASFTGAIRRFAVDAMHADRWPAAQGHEAALEQLFAAEQLVVLSPDAETPLLELDPGKASTRRIAHIVGFAWWFAAPLPLLPCQRRCTSLAGWWTALCRRERPFNWLAGVARRLCGCR